MSNRTRLNLNLPEQTMVRLRRLIKSSGLSRTGAICRAISTEDYITQQMAAGRRILIEGPDGELRELVLR